MLQPNSSMPLHFARFSFPFLTSPFVLVEEKKTKQKKQSDGRDLFLSNFRCVFPEESPLSDSDSWSSDLLEPSSICTQDQATMLLGDLQCRRLIYIYIYISLSGKLQKVFMACF